MMNLFLQASLLVLTIMTILWIISVIIKNVSIVDMFWGAGFVVVNAFYFYMSGDFYLRKIILMILVTLWGLRLSGYLAWRNIGKGEDFRYQEFRRSYGQNRYWWISFFQTFLLQGVLMIIISLPLLATNYSTNSGGLIWLDYIAIVVWIIGIIFEAGGDYQLSQFKKNPENKGKVLRTGLWKYTRHPNYFGDSAVWVSYAMFCIASGSYWPAAGSVIMILLIIKVSGVALLEKTLKDKKPEYQEYIRKTSSFFPMFPKK
jgi:steroid 5-alpha reductase family enzyme